jgi:hypothetical protein
VGKDYKRITHSNPKWKSLVRRAVKFGRSLQGTGIPENLGIQGFNFFPFRRVVVNMEALRASGYKYFEKEEADEFGFMVQYVYICLHWLYDSAASMGLIHEDVFESFLLPEKLKPVALYGPFTKVEHDGLGLVREGDKVESKIHPHVSTWLPNGGHVELALGGGFVAFRKDLHQRRILIDNFQVKEEQESQLSLTECDFSGAQVDILLPLGTRVAVPADWGDADLEPNGLFPKLSICRSLFDGKFIIHGVLGLSHEDVQGPLSTKPVFHLTKRAIHDALNGEHKKVDPRRALSIVYSRMCLHDKMGHKSIGGAPKLARGLASKHGVVLQYIQMAHKERGCDVQLHARGRGSDTNDIILLKRAGLESIPQGICDSQLQGLILIAQTLLAKKESLVRIDES